MPNRERLDTGGSYGLRERAFSQTEVDPASPLVLSPYHKRLGTAGSLRDRTNTVESIRSLESLDDTVSSPLRPRKLQTQHSVAKRVIDTIQSVTIPKWLTKHRTVHLITGIDIVYFGTVAAADVVKICGYQPPRYAWYMLSGSSCDVLQFLVDHVLYYREWNSASSWVVAFMASIVVRHTTHRYLVFGDYVCGYRASLMRMYMAYSFSIVVSTAFNYFVTRNGERHAGLYHSAIWIVTSLWTGVANYFILKYMWKSDKTSSTASTPTKSNVHREETLAQG